MNLEDVLKMIPAPRAVCIFVDDDGRRYEWSVRSCTVAEAEREGGTHTVRVEGIPPLRLSPQNPYYSAARENRLDAVYVDAWQRLTPKLDVVEPR